MAEDPRWETLYGRLEWLVVEEKQAGGSARSLAGRCGLSETHLSKIIERDKEAHRLRVRGAPKARVQGPGVYVIEQIAAGAGVSFSWLGKGEGWPNAATEARSKGRKQRRTGSGTRSAVSGDDGSVAAMKRKKPDDSEKEA